MYPSCVTLDKPLTLSELQLCYLLTKDKKIYLVYFMRVFQGPNEIAYGKVLSCQFYTGLKMPTF